MELYIYSILNTTEGELKTLKKIEEVHVNTVRFTDQTTQMKSMLREVDDWIPLKEHKPDTEVIALGYQDEMIIGYISYVEGVGECENEGVLLEEVTHWKPKPFTLEQVSSVL